jgi:hypothetical protein
VPDRHTGVNEQLVAYCHRVHEVNGDTVPSTLLIGAHSGAIAKLDYVHRYPLIATGDAVLFRGSAASARDLAHSITLAFSSSSSCS